MIWILTLFSFVSGSTLPPECPFENSPFHDQRSNIQDPWAEQQRSKPRASSPDGMDDVPWLTENLLPVSFDANSPVNLVKGADHFDQRNVGNLDPNQSAVQKWEMSSNVEPHNKLNWEQIFLYQGLSNTENTHNLPQSINAPSSYNINNPNHTHQPMGQSALYFKEFFKAKVASRGKPSTTTKPPATNTTRAVSTQNSSITSASVTHLVLTEADNGIE